MAKNRFVMCLVFYNHFLVYDKFKNILYNGCGGNY